MKSKPRDPATLTDDDLATMTDEEAARYIEANADRVDELFDDSKKVTIEPAAQGVDLVVSVRLKGHEAETLTHAARAAGKPLSTYLREASLAAATDGAPATRKVRIGELSPDAQVAVKAEVLDDILRALSSTGRSAPQPGLATYVKRAITPRRTHRALLVLDLGDEKVVREKNRTRRATQAEAAGFGRPA